MKFTAWFLFIMGGLLLAHWGFFLMTGQGTVVETAAYHLDLHLVGVGVTAVLLFSAGMGLMRHWQSARDMALIALGMFFYTLIVSPGYLAQPGQIVWVIIFAGLLLLAFWSLFSLLPEARPNHH